MGEIPAHLRAGPPALDLPTGLPVGAETGLAQAHDWDGLDEADRLRLRAVLKAARQEVEAGDLSSVEDLLADLT